MSKHGMFSLSHPIYLHIIYHYVFVSLVTGCNIKTTHVEILNKRQLNINTDKI